MRLFCYTLLLALAFCSAVPLHAQNTSLKSTPAAFANTYRFTEQDSVTGYNYAYIYTGPSGRRYMAPYDPTGISIYGNNWSRRLPAIDSFGKTSLVFYEPKTASPHAPVIAWAANRYRVYLLKGDSVNRIWPAPPHNDTAIRWQDVQQTRDGFYFIQYFNTGICQTTFFSFAKQSFDAPAEWRLPAGYNSLGITKDTSGRLYAVAYSRDSILLCRILSDSHQLQPVLRIPLSHGGVSFMLSEHSFFTTQPNRLLQTLWQQGKPITFFADQRRALYADRYTALRLEDNSFRIYDFLHTPTQPGHQMVSVRDGIQKVFADPVLGAYYISTPNKPLRVFPWIKQYPFLYGGTNTGATFSLTQDSAGNVWAGSYNGALTRIVGESAIPFPLPVGRIINGGCRINGKMYLIEEGDDGLTAFTPHSRRPLLSDSSTGFYTLLSRDKKMLYLGTPDNRGLWRTPVVLLTSGQPVWEKTGPSKGINLVNILTITEDTLGRIWCGHPLRGISVYDPAAGQGRTWRKDEGQGSVTAMASLTDSMGTVWLGGRTGLWYYNDYQQPPSPQNCRLITHPLLPPGKSITAFTVWKKDWLIIAAYDRILLLDLKTFYRSGEVKIRYLNPQEASFSSFTEQNTMFTSHTDGTVWFATSDNVYQWDIARWLALPTFHTSQRVTLHAAGSEEQLMEDAQSYHLEPGLRTFQIAVALTSPDALPRYMRTALVRDGDSVPWQEPSLQSIFTFNNAAAGRYRFLVEIFEPDGSVQRCSFRLHLKPHFWHTVWFWALVAALVSGAAFAIFYYKLKAQTKKAELEAFRAAQNKKLSDLRLLTMANQFRPHFILNALNTIGSRLENDPHTEEVLASLGNSINIIFNNAQRRGVLHPFPEEWKLVTEVIQIHRLMYLPQLRVTLPDARELSVLSNLKVPLGLLQIPVENALLHGLGNLQEGPYELHIGLLEHREGYEIVVTDTGVGRPAAAGLSNATGHGSGVSNLMAMLDLLSSGSQEKIEIIYEDEIYASPKKENSKFGTRVIIIIPKTFDYG